MTYDDFYKIVEETYSKMEGAHHYNKKGKLVAEPYRLWGDDGNGQTNKGNMHEYKVEWITGGASGGNCWGDSAEHVIESDPEPELDLTALFEKVCPNMTFLQYRKVMKDIVVQSNRMEHEYYGNYTEYSIKIVQYRVLYNKLVECKVISDV